MQRTSRIVTAVAIAAATAFGLTAGPATAGPGVAPATAPGSISDGPGTFAVFRTVDTGKQANAVDTAACNAYFGLRSFTVLQRLDARLYTFTNSPTTGFLTRPEANDVGPIYVCGTLGLDGRSIYEQYSRTTAPRIGQLEMSGPCALTLYLPEGGRGGAACVQRIKPNATGITDGVATSNSVTNPLRLPGGTTGSAWTFYTTGTASQPVAAPAPAQPQPTGSVKYSVGREVNSVSEGASATCPGGLRRTEIRPVGVDAATGALSAPSSSTAATASICYQKPAAPDFGATLTISISGVSLVSTASGQCRQATLTSIPTSRQQSCSFALPADLGRGLTGGQVTLNGLVPPGDAAGSDNSAVWSISVLGNIQPTF